MFRDFPCTRFYRRPTLWLYIDKSRLQSIPQSFYGNYPKNSVYSLRSRGTRERILILFRQQESRFLDSKLAAPLSFCRGFGPRFCVHWAQNEARSCFGVFRSVRRIVVFWELVFTPMAIDKKKCSPSADWTELI